MSVIPYPHIEPKGGGVWVTTELMSNTGQFASVLTGAIQTVQRLGSRWSFTVNYTDLSADDAARITQFLAACDGMANRFYLPVWGYTLRGAWPGSELFSNGSFASGTTSWTVDADGTLSAPDLVGRLTHDVGGAQSSIGQSVTIAQGVPYALRSIIHDGRDSAGLNLGVFVDGGDVSFSNYSTTARGLVASSLVGDTAGANSQFPLVFPTTGAFRAGDYAECSLASFARCALVDNGPNALIYSDQIDNAAWTKTRATITANSDVAPDGTTTADTLAEDGTATQTHHAQQAVTIDAAVDTDISFSCFIKADNRTWAELMLIEGTGSTTAQAFFNLSAGTVGSVGTGANWADTRAFIADAGNGWYYCTLVARKTNAATALTGRILAAEADADAIFSGLTQDSILLWRATLAEGSGVPTRPVQTVATADSDGTAQTGGALHVKGLPVSTDALLVAGDWVQIGDQLSRVRAPLNSDASGLGHLQVDPWVRVSPADSAPVFITNPVGKFLLDSSSISFQTKAGCLTDVSFTCMEDVAV